jgi:hypothetical protein
MIMRVLNVRNAALALVAGIGLSGCAYGPYGGLGVGVGYGNNGYYDPYYGGYGSYGYGAGYGYSPYGYGYSPYGWNNGFYYPGTGYYVYDNYRRPYRWTNAQRNYWLQRQRAYRARHKDNVQIRENWQDFRRDRRQDNRSFRVERRQDRVALRNGQVTRQEYRVDRKQDKKAYRQEIRQDRRELRRENRRDRRDDD